MLVAQTFSYKSSVAKTSRKYNSTKIQRTCKSKPINNGNILEKG